jgi:hypothetical protein
VWESLPDGGLQSRVPCQAKVIIGTKAEDWPPVEDDLSPLARLDARFGSKETLALELDESLLNGIGEGHGGWIVAARGAGASVCGGLAQEGGVSFAELGLREVSPAPLGRWDLSVSRETCNG